MKYEVFDVLSGDVKSTHADATEAFTESLKWGGEKNGFIVVPEGDRPELKVKPTMSDQHHDSEESGPGLFD